MTKRFILYCFSLFLGGSLFAKPFAVSIESQRDYEILERFFRWGAEEQEYGYVLQGIKPISVAEYGGIDLFRIFKDFALAKRRIETILLLEEAISVWNRVCPSHHQYILKAVPRKEPGSIYPGYEVSFICLPKLREVVQENASLFRYIMAPDANVEEIVHKIAFSNELLSDILKDDLTLMGIVLGYGAHNSLIYSRMDSISSLSISADTPPFSAKSVLMKNDTSREHLLSFFVPQCYGGHYLENAGGDSSYFKNFHRTYSFLRPSQKFSSLEEEVIAFSSKQEKTPECLNTFPRFIFGAFKGDSSNERLFNDLKIAQTEIRKLSKKSDFLNRVLEEIGGKKPIISCKKPPRSQSTLDLVGSDTKKWLAILKSHVKHLEDDRQRVLFVKAFNNPTDEDSIPPRMLGATKANLKGLKIALENLEKSNAYFQKIKKNTGLHPNSIVPERFYFRVDEVGEGESIQGIGQARMGFTFEDLEGNLLYANGDTWLELSQTFSGFMHGVQGMRPKEVRTLIIHPAYAYGALTTLPPCCTLIIKVKLHEIGDRNSSPLPPLQPLDFRWMEDPDYLRTIEESLNQIPRMEGAFYRKLLEEIREVDISQIKKSLGELLNSTCDLFPLQTDTDPKSVTRTPHHI